MDRQEAQQANKTDFTSFDHAWFWLWIDFPLL